MLDDRIVDILQYYSIGRVIETEDVEKGISSRAQLIHSNTGKYILRSLKGWEQGITEYVISERLSPYSIAPQIIASRTGKPCVEDNGLYYNLQRYIPHNPLPKDSLDFDILGQTISLFHKEIKHCDGIFQQEDRFNLEEMWLEASSILAAKDSEFFQEISNRVRNCVDNELPDTVYIHGDLGMWNMLFCDSQVYIIDFAEVRLGNHHFDAAAALASTLNLKAEEEVIKQLKAFSRGYEKNMAELNWNHLLKNIRLWFIRGIVANIKHNSAKPKAFAQCKNMLEALCSFEDLLSRVIG